MQMKTKNVLFKLFCAALLFSTVAAQAVILVPANGVTNTFDTLPLNSEWSTGNTAGAEEQRRAE